jgi:hypothetical protein
MIKNHGKLQTNLEVNLLFVLNEKLEQDLNDKQTQE